MQFKARSLRELADMICGNFDAETSNFRYRSSSYLTEFFQDCDTDFAHDGSTRWAWVSGVLEEILAGSQENSIAPPGTFLVVIQRLMDRADALNEGPDRPAALARLNITLAREGYEAFYAEGLCYLRHVKTNAVATVSANPHRPFSQAENEARALLSSFLDRASEDELIEDVLLPLFRQLGFRRITAAGHKDKALEYGKDIWMKFVLPTSHVIYFGLQAKRGKLDAAGRTQNNNVAEVLAQVRMALGHKLFDAEINKRTLVDHVIIVAGGEITKQARNWLGEQLDVSARSQILFMDRDDILNLFIVHKVPLPVSAQPAVKSFSIDDEIPF
jgi:hypothetical protein